MAWLDLACAKAWHALGALEWSHGRHVEAQGHLERALTLGDALYLPLIRRDSGP